jgi:hypothetical protein
VGVEAGICKGASCEANEGVIGVHAFPGLTLDEGEYIAFCPAERPQVPLVRRVAFLVALAITINKKFQLLWLLHSTKKFQLLLGIEHV